MRIEDVRTYEISYERRNLQVVHITTDEGLDGVGEAGLTSSELAVAGAVAHFRDQLIGEDASRIEHFWQHLHRGTFFRGGVVFAAALSAIDIALWDLQAKPWGCRCTGSSADGFGTKSGPTGICISRSGCGWKTWRRTRRRRSRPAIRSSACTCRRRG